MHMPSYEQHISDLNTFMHSKPDAREVVRALAVKFALLGYDYQWISMALAVSDSFVSKWKGIFEHDGIDGLRLAHKGRQSLLTHEQKTAIHAWIHQQSTCTLLQLKNHMHEQYGVVYQSEKSYYALLHDTNYSWKKSQKTHPDADPPAIIAKKKEIHDYLERHAEAIARGDLIVYIWDECHVLWGDICGYVWGSTEKRINLLMTNERQRQTYYGAINYATRTLTLRAYKTGDSAATLHFLDYVRAQHPGKKVTILWDGASYHTSTAIRTVLAAINSDLPEDERPVHLIQFAPYAPSQNPIEAMWLKGKRFLRSQIDHIHTFADVKRLFMDYLHKKVCDFPANCSLV